MYGGALDLRRGAVRVQRRDVLRRASPAVPSARSNDGAGVIGAAGVRRSAPAATVDPGRPRGARRPAGTVRTGRALLMMSSGIARPARTAAAQPTNAPLVMINDN